MTRSRIKSLFNGQSEQSVLAKVLKSGLDGIFSPFDPRTRRPVTPDHSGINIIPPSGDFQRAAKDTGGPSQPRFKHGSVDLWNEVINEQGKVDMVTARQFLDSFEQGLFAKNPQISDKAAKQDLSEVGFETVIGLYESVAEQPMDKHSLYLDMLNKAINVQKAELEDWTSPIKEFFSPKNKAFIEKKWTAAKKSGQIAKEEGSFEEIMVESFNNPELTRAGDYLRRAALLQFISDAYSDFVGEDRVDIQLIQGQPGLGGYHAKDPKTGKQVIGINVNNFAFQTSFHSILNVLNHERYHATDQRLGDMYNDGKIKKGDDNYRRARIAAAAMKQYGYIRPDYIAGPLAYREQVIEVGAHYAGKVGEHFAQDTYAKQPEPVISMRNEEGRNKLAEIYEKAAKAKQQKNGPENGGAARMTPPSSNDDMPRRRFG